MPGHLGGIYKSVISKSVHHFADASCHIIITKISDSNFDMRLMVNVIISLGLLGSFYSVGIASQLVSSGEYNSFNQIGLHEYDRTNVDADKKGTDSIITENDNGKDNYWSRLMRETSMLPKEKKKKKKKKKSRNKRNMRGLSHELNSSPTTDPSAFTFNELHSYRSSNIEVRTI